MRRWVIATYYVKYRQMMIDDACDGPRRRK